MWGLALSPTGKEIENVNSPAIGRPLIPYWCRGCWVIVVVIIIIVIWKPPWLCEFWGCDSTGPPPDPQAQIVFAHDGVMAMTPIANTFSENFKSGAGSSVVYHPRSGFLIQLGSYASSGSMPFFERVTFYKNGTAIGTLTKDQFDWMDIIGAKASDATLPLDPSSRDPFLLWPEGMLHCTEAGVGECVALLTAFNTSNLCACNDCSNPLDAEEVCFRTRKIHGRFASVTNIVTLWQGDEGIDVDLDAVAMTSSGRVDSKYSIRFDNSFAVTAYRVGSNCVMDVVQIPGDWDQIEFTANLLPGQGGGVRVDPPWP